MLSADQIIDIGNEMSVQASIFANVWSQIKQNIMRIFHPLEVVGRGCESQLQVVNDQSARNFCPVTAVYIHYKHFKNQTKAAISKINYFEVDAR